jgi:cysteinyl-tRNA synthetase
LQAAEKGYKRLMETRKILQSLVGKSAVSTDLDKEVTDLMTAAYDDMSDDFNAPKALGRLFELSSKINALKGGQLDLGQITEGVLSNLKTMFDDFIVNIFGLQDETATSENGASALEGVMNLVIDLRAQARTNKDWGTSDKIRDGLKTAGIQLKDAKEGTTWTTA